MAPAQDCEVGWSESDSSRLSHRKEKQKEKSRADDFGFYFSRFDVSVSEVFCHHPNMKEVDSFSFQTNI